MATNKNERILIRGGSLEKLEDEIPEKRSGFPASKIDLDLAIVPILVFKGINATTVLKITKSIFVLMTCIFLKGNDWYNT